MHRTALIVALMGLLAQTLLALDGWPAALQGGGMTVQFDAGAAPAGTIRRGEQAFPFTGTLAGNVIKGQFKAGNQAFDFTLERAGDAFTLTTGNSRFALAPAGGAPAGGAPAQNAVPPGTMLLEPKAVKDSRTTLDVSTLLVPQGWQIDDKIIWQIDKAFFVTAASTVFDPKSGWGVRWIPRDAFNCLPITYQAAVQQRQSLITISGYELTDQVLSPTDYIKKVVLPRYRNVPGVKLVSAEELPKVAQHYQVANQAIDQAVRQQGIEKQYGAARARIEYPGNNNITYQEEIYCFMELTWSPRANAMAAQAGQPGAQSWIFSPVELYGFVAPRGELEKATPLLQTIFASTRITREWYAFTNNIENMLRQAAQRDMDAIMKMRKDITESQQKSWQDMVKQMARHSDTVGHLLANTQSYVNPSNPNGPPIVLPAGAQPYMNQQGQIQPFPAGSTPPVGSGWTAMQPVNP